MLINVQTATVRIDFNNYTKEENDSCSCWNNQAVDAFNTKFNSYYATNKQIEVTGYRQSEFILYNKAKTMAYKLIDCSITVKIPLYNQLLKRP